MTPAEAYDLITKGGATEFGSLIEACEAFGPYCMIGGFAVNRYVEPVYTLDADLILVASNLSKLTEYLQKHGFRIETQPHSVNASTAASQLRIQFSTDQRYQSFLLRSVESEVLGVKAKVACLRDVTQGKFWAYSDPKRRFSRRKKDELDLIRLAESYLELKSMYPSDLIAQIAHGGQL